MLIFLEDKVINFDHVAMMRVYEGAGMIEFYGVSVYGGDHLLANYKLPSGYTFNDIFKMVEDAQNNFNRSVRLPVKAEMKK